MPCRPSAPIFGQRSLGNWLLLSISAARGAISLLEKAETVSRIASAVSPRSKLNIRYALGIMVRRPPADRNGFVAQSLIPCRSACHGPQRLRRAIGRALFSPMFYRHTPRKRSIQYSRDLSVHHYLPWNTGSPGLAGRRQV